MNYLRRSVKSGSVVVNGNHKCFYVSYITILSDKEEDFITDTQFFETQRDMDSWINDFFEFKAVA